MKKLIIPISTILIAFAIGIYLYPNMPAQMASHWNSAGQVDSYMSKFWGLFLMPIISTGLLLLFIFIPRLDPLKKNIEKFRKYFDGFISLLMVFLLYIYLLTIFWNLEYRFNMTVMMLPALAILFYYVGILVEHSKPNWFIGIRTPWTLSNEIVWEKTHKLGAKLFKGTAMFSLLGLIFQKYAIWIFLIPMIAAAIFIIVYSYFEFKKQVKN